MDKYVSKEIAIERIKRVKPHVVMSEYGVGYERGLKDAIGILNATPVADVQPAIHCKDCKYTQNPNDTMIYCTYFECGTMSQDDFCSQGDRRTENG